MLRILGRTAPLLALVLLPATLATPATAAGTGTLTGRVVDQYGHVLPGATVYVSNSRGLYKQVSTGRRGRFSVSLSSAVPADLRVVDTRYAEFRDKTFTALDVAAGAVTRVGDLKVRLPGTPGRATGSIDTTTRSAVGGAYRKRLAPLVVNERLYTPSKARPCSVAYDAAYARQRARQIKAVNFMRRMEGLEPVAENTTLSHHAAAAALIEYHLGYLDHFPPKSSRCWTRTGGAAAGRSNLSYGTPGAGVVGGYMADPGSSNVEVGHRSWILDPWQVEMGTGNVGTFNALYVLSGKQDRTQSLPRSITWPTAGWFPLELEPGGRWSWSTTRAGATRIGQAKVSVTKAGRHVGVARVTRSPVTYGELRTISWDLKRQPTAGTYRVRISGLVVRGVAQDAVTYRVRLFSAR